MQSSCSCERCSVGAALRGSPDTTLPIRQPRAAPELHPRHLRQLSLCAASSSQHSSPVAPQEQSDARHRDPDPAGMGSPHTGAPRGVPAPLGLHQQQQCQQPCSNATALRGDSRLGKVSLICLDSIPAFMLSLPIECD